MNYFKRLCEEQKNDLESLIQTIDMLREEKYNLNCILQEKDTEISEI